MLFHQAAHDLKLMLNISVFRQIEFFNIKKEEADSIFVFSFYLNILNTVRFLLKMEKLIVLSVFSLKYHFYKNKNSPISWNGEKLLNLKVFIGA